MSRLRVVVRGVVCLGFVAVMAGPAVAGQTGFVYALQQVPFGANQIHGFRIDESTGTLTALAGFPMASGGAGTAAAHSEQLAYFNGKLFVINNSSDTLSVFSVDASSGALSAMPFSPIALGSGNWSCVAVHPNGSPVVVGNASGTIASFVVSDVSATAATGSPFTTGLAFPYSCRFVNGQVYAGGTLGANIAGFGVDPVTGVLTPLAGSPFNSGSDAVVAYASDSSGRLFAASSNSPQVLVYTASGVLSAATGNPFASGLVEAVQGILHPGGFYMVADRGGNRVGVYQIAGAGTATTLAAVSGSPFASGGTSTTALALTQAGGHLVASNGGSRNLTVFAVNQATGALSPISTQSANALGSTGTITGLVFAPAEVGFVYSLTQLNNFHNQIYGFRINPDTGGLTALPGFPMVTGGNGSIAAAAEHMAYRNGRLYVLNDGSDTLSAFKVNRTTGALTALPFSPIALPAGTGFQGCVAVHPSGSPVVVGNGGGGTSSINVATTSATFAAGSPFNSPGLFTCAFSQDGNYFYGGASSGNSISGFSVNASTGVLTALAGSPFNSGDSGPAGFATDGAGRLFMTRTSTPGQLRAFTTASGVPSAVSGNPFATAGIEIPIHGVLHPAGFFMVAGKNTINVGVFRISGTGVTTTLSQVAASPFSTGASLPTALALTSGGAYLAVAASLNRSLSVHRVNPATGNLTAVVTQGGNTLGPAGLVSGIAFAEAVAPFNDDPLTAMPALSRVIKTTHITELRVRIDAARAQYGLAPYSYSTPTLTAGATVIQAAHVNDLRLALADVYNVAGMTPPTYTDLALGSGTIIVKAVHIMELRAAVIAIE